MGTGLAHAFLGLFSCCLASGTSRRWPGLSPPDKVHFPFDAQALSGRVHTLSVQRSEAKSCFHIPVDNVPDRKLLHHELNRLQRGLPAGVELYGVVSEAGTSRQKASEHFVEYQSRISDSVRCF